MPPALSTIKSTSQLVLDEAGEGEPPKASERLALLAVIELLDLNEEVEALASRLVETGILPASAIRDASHLAAAGVHGMDFLLTWNCTHIANPFIADRLRSCFSQTGIDLPTICTPEQFVPDANDDSRNTAAGND